MYPLGNDGIEMVTSLDQGTFRTPITQIDFTESDLVCGNSYLDMDDGYYPYALNGIHLVLRPLSDLTEEYAKGVGYNLFNLKFEIKNRTVQLRVFNKLCSDKYDVNSLIPAGVAIDINTLE